MCSVLEYSRAAIEGNRQRSRVPLTVFRCLNPRISRERERRESKEEEGEEVETGKRERRMGEKREMTGTDKERQGN